MAAVLEADMLRELNSEYVIEYNNKFIEGNDMIIVMEYCEYGDLSFQLKKIKQEGTILTEDQVMAWFC